MLKIGAQTGFRTVITAFAKPPTGTHITKESRVLVNFQSVRNTSFFNKLSYETLWKGVTSLSNAGKKRGRGRLGDRKQRKTEEVKKIGDGEIKVLWPGLNYSVLGKEGISQIKKVDRENNEETAPAPTTVKKTRGKIHPLDRGWSGKRTTGRFIGPPDPIQDETFEDFNSVVLEAKLCTIMTGVLGRKRSFFSLVATGNGNGIIGVGVAKRIDIKTSIKLAKARASKRLLTINLIEKNKINHDFFEEYGRTRISVFKKPDGYGLVAHRIITALCKLIGIENLYAKVEGAINPKHIIRAFIVGLMKQKTYQDIADEKKLHLVEFKEETMNFPNVLASPEKCLTPAEARRNPVLFEEYIMGGKLVYDRGPKIPFYQKLPTWSKHLRRTLFYRNHYKAQIELLSKYGSCTSHLTKVYPECRREI